MLCRVYVNNEPTDLFQMIDPSEFDSDEGVESLYRKQKKRGIHITKFEDDKWILTDQYETWRLNFSEVESWPSNYSKEAYLKALKRYAVILLDQRAICSVQKNMKMIISFGNKTNGWIKPINVPISEDQGLILEEFGEFVHIDISELIFEADVESKPREDERRNLSTAFFSYCVFDKELKEFWNTATKDEKIIYGPIYLFWKVCNVIPTRPRAFCMMPYDCIQQDDEGNYYLTMRRSVIKGSGKKPHNDYRKDYPTAIFRVTEEIANDILVYQEYVGPSGTDMLFSNNKINEILGKKCIGTFKRIHLKERLDMFYQNVLVNEKGYKIKEFEEGEVILDYTSKWIELIRLGDLRHLSMITMIFLGVDPGLIMELAGQDSITSACHYFSNVSSLSNTYIRYLDSIKGGKKREQRFNLSKKAYTGYALVKVNGGYCECHSNEKGKYCARYISHEGCPYFVPTSTTYIKEIEESNKIELAATIREMEKYIIAGNRERIIHSIRDIQDKLEESRRLESICQDLLNLPMNY